MGQVTSLGKLSKKGQIAPAGPPAPGMAPPTQGSVKRAPPPPRTAPVVGKRYPTYSYTTFIVSYPVLSLSIFCLTPFILTCVALFVHDIGDYNTKLETFEISDHKTVKLRDTMIFAAEDWNQILEAYVHRRSMGTNPGDDGLPTVIGSLPWRRIFIQYKVKKLRGELIPDPACRPSDSNYQALLNEYNLLKNPEAIHFIRQLENWIVRLPPFSKLCFRSLNKNGYRKRYDQKPTCAPLASIAGYFYPGKIKKEEDDRFFWSFQPEYDFGPYEPETGANSQQGTYPFIYLFLTKERKIDLSNKKKNNLYKKQCLQTTSSERFIKTLLGGGLLTAVIIKKLSVLSC